jgi:indoleamine 2,3-dioxygenase
MAYAAAYSLYNFRFANHSVGYSSYDNLRLIRAFEYGLDPKSSEAGFILTHVDMVKHSGPLVKGAVDLLRATASSTQASAVDALDLLLETMTVIEASMETMWANSKPKDYISYRTFIFGITNQSMYAYPTLLTALRASQKLTLTSRFPNGVIYEGENDGKAMSFRGESGANDAMIPLMDHLLQIPMPANPLTTILKDFRNYRPKPHREFLTAVREEAEVLGVRSYCCKDLDSRVRYLRLLNHVRSFRWRHWQFTREYIIKRTAHPTATGGSPIIRWLPNQLFAVMDLMCEVWNGISEEERVSAQVGKPVVEMMDEVQDLRVKLQKEVEKWCQERDQ